MSPSRRQILTGGAVIAGAGLFGVVSRGLLPPEPSAVLAPADELARALAAQPRFILLDEPLAGIDPIAVAEIRDLVSHLKDRGIRVNTGMEIDSLEAIASMVKHGLGVSVVPDRAGAELPADIEKIPFGDPPLCRVIGVVERRDNPKAHLTRALVEILSGLAGDKRPRRIGDEIKSS